MIAIDDRHRLHRFLMTELAVRYLEKDLEILQTTKCAQLFTSVFESILQQLRAQYKREQQYFAKKQVRIIRWQRMDTYFSKVSVTTQGEDAVFTYANQAVKMHVEEIIKDTYQSINN